VLGVRIVNNRRPAPGEQFPPDPSRRTPFTRECAASQTSTPHRLFIGPGRRGESQLIVAEHSDAVRGGCGTEHDLSRGNKLRVAPPW